MASGDDVTDLARRWSEFAEIQHILDVFAAVVGLGVSRLATRSAFVEGKVSFLADTTLVSGAWRKSARDCTIADRRDQCPRRARCPANGAARLRLARSSRDQRVSSLPRFAECTKHRS